LMYIVKETNNRKVVMLVFKEY